MIGSRTDQSITAAIAQQVAQVFSSEGMRSCDPILYGIMCTVDPARDSNDGFEDKLQAQAEEFARKHITFQYLQEHAGASHSEYVEEAILSLQHFLGGQMTLSDADANAIATAVLRPCARELSTIETVKMLRQKLLRCIQVLHAAPLYREYFGHGGSLDEITQESNALRDAVTLAEKNCRSLSYKVSVIGV
jgi:hypothetical protein